MTVAILARPWPWLVVICLVSGDARATRPRPPDPADRITEGRLVTERNGARIDVPIEHTDVRIAIDGFLAEAVVTQRFRNPYPSKIEAVYLFPLPTGAAVSAMRVTSGDRVIEGEMQLPAVAYGAGKVYVSGGFESVSFYALDAETGRVAWATTNLEDNGPTAAVFEDDRVLFNTESCTLFALDARTGRRLWFRNLGDPTLAQVTTADGLVYASHPGDGGQQLSAYRVMDGEPVWTRSIGTELLAAPVIAGDAIYAATLDGEVFRFARRTGKLAWSRALDATTAPWMVGNELFVTRKRGRREQQIVVAADTGKILRDHDQSTGRYAGDVPGMVGSLGDGTWQSVWAFEGSRPVVDRGVRYVAMGGEIRASDAATGALLWQRRDPGAGDHRSVGSVALAGSQVVIATRDGKLFGLDVDTGYTLWSYAIGHRVVAEPVIARGWIYASTADGYVVALQVGDRTLDGWHMFGGNPRHDGPVAAPPAGDPPQRAARL